VRVAALCIAWHAHAPARRGAAARPRARGDRQRRARTSCPRAGSSTAATRTGAAGRLLGPLSRGTPSRCARGRGTLSARSSRPRATRASICTGPPAGTQRVIIMCTRGSMPLEACPWKHALGSMPLEACPWKHALGSMPLEACPWKHALAAGSMPLPLLCCAPSDPPSDPLPATFRPPTLDASSSAPSPLAGHGKSRATPAPLLRFRSRTDMRRTTPRRTASLGWKPVHAR
jgi:hypothetical protein